MEIRCCGPDRLLLAGRHTCIGARSAFASFAAKALTRRGRLRPRFLRKSMAIPEVSRNKNTADRPPPMYTILHRIRMKRREEAVHRLQYPISSIDKGGVGLGRKNQRTKCAQEKKQSPEASKPLNPTWRQGRSELQRSRIKN